MVWSNWQGAIGRGALVVLLFWTGLAWTQTPTPQPTTDSAERIMVVHENGKSTRCRVMETWQLPDGRVAHLLQAIETGEMVTIVDETGPTPQSMKNPRLMPKRIFTWGSGRRSPPEGSPIPPHLRIDSGIVIKNEALPPIDAVPEGPVIVNRLIDGKPVNEGAITIVQNMAPTKVPTLRDRLFGKRETAPLTRDPQVVEFRNAPPGSAPMIVNDLPPMPMANVGTPRIELPAPPQPIDSFPNPTLPTTSTPILPQPTLPATSTPIIPYPMLPATSTPMAPTPILPATVGAAPAAPGTIACDPASKELRKPVEAAVKKSWRPGSNIQTWLQGRAAPSAPKTEVAPGAIVFKDKTDAEKAEETQKMQKLEDHLAQQNKMAEKQLAQRIEKSYGQPFSTAQMALPDAPQPDKTNGQPFSTARPPVPFGPQPEIKKPTPTPTPLAIPAGESKDGGQLVVPPPMPKDFPTKPVGVSTKPKEDMWGNLIPQPVPAPGQTLVDSGLVKAELGKLPPAPLTRPNDPLFSPERLIAANDSARPLLGPVAPPLTRPAPEPNMLPNAPAAGPGQPIWPLGTQSVQAASSGLMGTPTYIPVPTVTVPQPNNPPLPPAPQLPDPPQLNAFVNAFSPPPTPKNAQQQMPAMTQQQLAYQQAMAQQQLLMQYGYRPNAMMMASYMPQQQPMMPSTGPTANYSRQYMGPQAPNPVSVNVSVQAGFTPAWGYSQMPQAPMMQQVAYQQPALPTQQPSLTQQVEQCIKVMRESPYPAQREWAAQSLVSFEWRAHPQIVPALIQSASQDPAASVRAGCVNSLGRMNANIEPVVGVLHSLRNDIDPRVRTEVERAFVGMGQTPQ